MDNSPNPELIAGVAVAAVVVLVFLVAIGVWTIAKKRFNGMTAGMIYASVNPEYISAGDGQCLLERNLQKNEKTRWQNNSLLFHTRAHFTVLMNKSIP